MTDLRSLTPAQRRMTIQSFIGGPARVTSRERTFLCEVLGLGYDLHDDPTHAKTVVVRHTAEDNRLIVMPLPAVHAIEAAEWSRSDPRHPEYEPPGKVAHPRPNERVARQIARGDRA